MNFAAFLRPREPHGRLGSRSTPWRSSPNGHSHPLPLPTESDDETELSLCLKSFEISSLLPGDKATSHRSRVKSDGPLLVAMEGGMLQVEIAAYLPFQASRLRHH